MKKISVLISVYKNDNSFYFDESIKSIWCNQTYKPYEIVLVQDGDVSDSLKNVIIKWKQSLKSKLVHIINPTNIGLTKSLNIGLMSCNGDYIARMDADDISKQERFLLQVEYLEKYKNIDVLGGSMQEFSSENDCLFIRSYPKTNIEILNKIHISSPFCHPSVMFRRKIFDEGNFYNNNFITSQDIDFWFSLISRGYKMSNLENVILLFRINDNTAKRRSIKKGINEFKIYTKGIFLLFGYSYKLIYPFIRISVRFLPLFLIRLIYKSNVRKILNHK